MDRSLSDVQQVWKNPVEYKTFESLRKAKWFDMDTSGKVSPNVFTEDALSKYAQAQKRNADNYAAKEAKKKAEQKRATKNEWLRFWLGMGIGFILGIFASVIGAHFYSLLAG